MTPREIIQGSIAGLTILSIIAISVFIDRDCGIRKETRDYLVESGLHRRTGFEQPHPDEGFPVTVYTCGDCGFTFDTELRKCQDCGLMFELSRPWWSDEPKIPKNYFFWVAVWDEKEKRFRGYRD